MLLMDLKFARDSLQDRNSAGTEAWRSEYCEWLKCAEVVNAMKIYFDEFGCNIHIKRTFGRSKKGERAHGKIASQSGGNKLFVLPFALSSEWYIIKCTLEG